MSEGLLLFSSRLLCVSVSLWLPFASLLRAPGTSPPRGTSGAAGRRTEPGSPPSPSRSRRGSPATGAAGHRRSARTAPARPGRSGQEALLVVRVVQFVLDRLLQLGQDRPDVRRLLLGPLGQLLLQALRPVPRAGLEGLTPAARAILGHRSSSFSFTASDGSSSVAAARTSCISLSDPNRENRPSRIKPPAVMISSCSRWLSPPMTTSRAWATTARCCRA